MNAILQYLVPGDQSTLLSKSTVIFLLVATNLTNVMLCYVPLLRTAALDLLCDLS